MVSDLPGYEDLGLGGQSGRNQRAPGPPADGNPLYFFRNFSGNLDKRRLCGLPQEGDELIPG